MRTKSAKAKGRRLQDHVRDFLNCLFDVKCRAAIMGETGADIKYDPDHPMSEFYIECKNKETISVFGEFKKLNCNPKIPYPKIPLLVIARNRQEPLVVLNASEFFNFLYRKELMKKELASYGPKGSTN